MEDSKKRKVNIYHKVALYPELDTEAVLHLDRTVKLIARLCQSEVAIINIDKNDHEYTASIYGAKLPQYNNPIKLPSLAELHSKNGISVKQNFKDSEIIHFNQKPMRLEALSHLITRHGHKIGTVAIFNSKRTQLTKEKINILKGLSDSIIEFLEAQPITPSLKTDNNLNTYAEILNKHAIVTKVDTRGILTFANELFLKTSGFKQDQILGKNLLHQIKHTNDSKFIKKMWKQICSGKQWKGEIKSITQSATSYWLDTTIFPNFDSDGNICEFITISTDITASKNKSHKDIIISEIREKYLEYHANPNNFFSYVINKILVETQSQHALIGEVLYDNNMKHFKTFTIADSSWNEEIRRFFNDRSLLGVEIKNLKPFTEQILQTETAIVKNTKMSIQEKDEDQVRSIAGFPLFYSGKFVGIIAFANKENGYDQTIIEEWEKTFNVIGELIGHHKMNREILNKTSFLNFTLEDTGLGLWSWNLDSQKVEFDSQCLNIFQAVGHKSITDFEGWSKLIHPNDLIDFQNCIDEYESDKTKNFFNIHRIMGINGEVKYIQAKGRYSEWDTDAKPTRMTGTILDITEKRDMELKLQHNSKLASIGQLAAGVGHEINNPLAIIKGYAATLKRKEKGLSDESIKYVNIINSASDRIAKIVSGLRSFSRVDENNLTQDFKPLEVITETVNMLKTIYLQDRVEIQVSNVQDSAFIEIYGDRGKFQQTLINLISNAKDALHQDNEDSKITISSKFVNNSFKLSISDNGSGIAVSIQDKIFDPFFTTKDIGKGTGIGLSFVHKFIKDDFQGEIDLISEEGIGTTFKISIPARLVSSSKSLTTPASFVNDTIKAQKDFLISVIIAEDESEIRNLLTELLIERGAKVSSFENGELAYNEYMKNPKSYDLIISDIQMPKLDGLSFLRRIRKNKNLKQPVFYFITGGVHHEFNNQLAEINQLSDGHFLKPFNYQEVINEIQNAIKAKNKALKAS